ncbi:ral GTPase-activating protein subunit alpha-2-like [Sycon ciliatum]|uniref:ral GTPase-activating protein subunit alpha-2-like n=1 Tax=Sycon ciliatum TaxID=27933 RepID=UPI0031F6416D
MFGHKRNTDSKQAVEKFLDSKKESIRRLRYLLSAVDRQTTKANKALFEQYYYVVYQVFHDAFTVLENSIKSRGGRLRVQHDSTHQEFFEVVVPVLEKILIFLPNLVYRRWQSTSIGVVLSKFLHHGSAPKIRKAGMNLLMLWVQGLRENVTPFAEHLFASVVPGIVPVSERRSSGVPWDGAENSWISGPDVTTSAPDLQGSDTVTDVATVAMLEDFLESLTSQCVSTIWDTDAAPHNGFDLLFHLFKKHYLFALFKEARLHNGPFDGGKSMFKCPKPSLLKPEQKNVRVTGRVVDAIARWMMKWMTSTQAHAPPCSPVHPFQPDRPPPPDRSSQPGSLDMDSPGEAAKAQLASEELSALVTDVLYESHENVVLIHEVLRCVFFLPARFHYETQEMVIEMIHQWAKAAPNTRPLFMQDAAASPVPPSPQMSINRHVTRPRSTSDALLAIKSVKLARSHSFGVRAGFVSNMLVFITETSQVLVATVKGDGTGMDEQEQACQKVIEFYRALAFHVTMTSDIWVHLHATLLHATNHVLQHMGQSPLQEQIAPAMLNTLLQLMVNASLAVVTPIQMWNRTLELLSHQSRHFVVIQQWAIAMNMLTDIMAQQVFNMQLKAVTHNRRPSHRTARSTNGGGNSGGNSGSLKSAARQQQQHSQHGGSTSLQHQAEVDADSSDLAAPGASVTDSPHIGTGPNGRLQQRATVQRNTSLQVRSTVDALSNASSSSFDGHSGSGRPSSLASISDPGLATEDSAAPSSLASSHPSSANTNTANRRDLPLSLDSPTSRKAHARPTLTSTASKDRSLTLPNVGSQLLEEEPITGTMHPDSKQGREDGIEVVLGGRQRGWTPVSAAVLWRRMLGLLGNPNLFADPSLHDDALRCLGIILDILFKLHNCEGEPVKPDLPLEYDPPLLVFAPWCFQACDLPDKYLAGKLRAYELLCRMTIVRHDHTVSEQHLSHFYRTLYKAFTSENLDVVDCVVRHCKRMFTYCLPGSSCLINALLNVAASILKVSEPPISELSKKLSNNGEQQAPASSRARPETDVLSALGALLQVEYLFPHLPVNMLGSSEPETTFTQIKDRIIKLLLKVARFQTGPLTQSARCLSISMVGMYVFSELVHRRRGNSRCAEGIYTLLCAIGNTNSEVVLSAIEMLFLLTDYKPGLPENMVKKIVESLCSCASFVITEDFAGPAPPAKARETVLVRMLQCMVKWTMGLESSKLLAQELPTSGQNLLNRVFQILHNACGRIKPQDVLKPRRPSTVSDPNGSLDSPSSPMTHGNESHVSSVTVNLAARAALEHLIAFLDHYPFCAGAARPCSTVIECDDHTRYKNATDLAPNLFTAPNVQFFAYDSSTIISVSEIEPDSGQTPEELQVGGMMTRLIVRNLSGKWTWDARSLHGIATETYPGLCESLDPNHNLMSDAHTPVTADYPSAFAFDGPHGAESHDADDVSQQQQRQHRPSAVPSATSFTATDGDHFHELLEYIATTSAECLSLADTCLSVPTACDDIYDSAVEAQLVKSIDLQHTVEQNYLRHRQGCMTAAACTPAQSHQPTSVFHNSRYLLQHLGFLGVDKMKSLKMLNKNDKLRRELKHLDSRPFRETHKIGVVYVGPGQAEKTAILSNTKGSAQFEAFVAAISWEVDLAAHPGFMGGLQRNATTGSTAPYYATSMCEVLFHVSTRMPTLEEKGIINKLRHIGNDEVQIIWSEHSRDWRRDIIRTEFGDVMIILYPMKSGLCRVQILTKPGGKLPHFGPLFDGAVVDIASLPALVRATAINANRAKRSELPFFQQHYEERATYIANLSRNCTKNITMEEFFADMVRPGTPDDFSPAHCRQPDVWRNERQHRTSPLMSRTALASRPVLQKSSNVQQPSTLSIDPVPTPTTAEEAAGEEVFS